MKAKIKTLKTSLVGRTLTGITGSKRGHEVENIMINDGFPVDVHTKGPDIQAIGVEIKNRDLDSSSPHTVGSMTIDYIVATDYKNTYIAQKLQQQLRVKVKDNVVQSADIYDFSSNTIQDLIEQSYEAGRQRIINGDRHSYISSGKFGYFEQKSNSPNSYSFRLSNYAMNAIERISTSTYDKFFQEAQ
jgi:hypothetical protein